MKNLSFDIPVARLIHQRIAGKKFASPEDVVQWMGAVQAQDFLGSLWGIGLRTEHSTEVDVERAIEQGRIVRTWPMRGTLHFVPAGDVRWMLALLTPRVLKRNAARLERDFEITKTVLARSKTILVRALQREKRLTREEAYALLDAGGVAASRQRGLHILWWLAQEGIVCLGPRQGKQQTIVLLDEWVPSGASPGREEGLSLLADRYFASHGPARIQDFAWWSGLTLSEAARTVDAINEHLTGGLVDGEVQWWTRSTPVGGHAPKGLHLLPPFDEFTVAYKDRDALLHPAYRKRGVVGLGIISPAIVSDSQVIGTWGRRIANGRVTVEPGKGTPLSKKEQAAFLAAAQMYGAFLRKETVVKTVPPKRPGHGTGR